MKTITTLLICCLFVGLGMVNAQTEENNTGTELKKTVDARAQKNMQLQSDDAAPGGVKVIKREADVNSIGDIQVAPAPQVDNNGATEEKKEKVAESQKIDGAKLEQISKRELVVPAEPKTKGPQK